MSDDALTVFQKRVRAEEAKMTFAVNCAVFILSSYRSCIVLFFLLSIESDGFMIVCMITGRAQNGHTMNKLGFRLAYLPNVT